MKRKILDCFTNCILNNGWPDIEFLMPYIESASKEICKGKEQWIDEWQIKLIIHRFLYLRIREIPKPKRTVSNKLTEVFSAEEIEQIVNEIIEFTDSIPHEYYFFFKIPQLNASAYSLYTVTNDISLVRVEDIPKPLLALDFGGKIGVSTGTYVRVRVTGYTDNDYNCNTIAEAFSKFKQFIYLNLLKGNIILNSQYSTWEPKPKGKVEYINMSHKEHLVNNVQISESLADFISKLKLKDELINKNRKALGTEEYEPLGLRAILFPDPNYVEPLMSEKEKYILDSNDSNENTTSFKNALQWGFDSLANQHDHTMSFIQHSVALEAILGIESNRGEGLTMQLADRCAYFIGKNNTDRRKIRDDFKKFYGVRSTLLHGRSKKISKSEAEWLNWGRSTLDHILRKDLLFSKFE